MGTFLGGWRNGRRETSSKGVVRGVHWLQNMPPHFRQCCYKSVKGAHINAHILTCRRSNTLNRTRQKKLSQHEAAESGCRGDVSIYNKARGRCADLPKRSGQQYREMLVGPQIRRNGWYLNGGLWKGGARRASNRHRDDEVVVGDRVDDGGRGGDGKGGKGSGKGRHGLGGKVRRKPFI